MIVLITQDLIFASRLKQSAERAAVRLRLCAGPPDFATLPEPLTLAVIDLHLPRLDVAGTIQTLRKEAPGVRIVAYAGHVMIDALREARQAGCDDVLTRGEFDRRMDELVAAQAEASS